MTTFIPRATNPERSASICEHAMRWYADDGRGAGQKARPVKVRLITNPAAAFAYFRALLRASLDRGQRGQGDARR